MGIKDVGASSVHHKRLHITTAIKVATTVLLLASGAVVTETPTYLFAGLLETCAAFLLSDWLLRRSYVLGYLVNSVLLLVINVQAAMLFFAASFVTPIMISNLFNLADLAGQAGTYIGATVLVLFISFLPITSFGDIPFLGTWGVIGVAALLELTALLGFGSWASPLGSTAALVAKWDRYASLMEHHALEDGGVDNPSFRENAQAYYCEEVLGGITRPTNLPERPNVIVIFTEGLSQSIIDDERGIMPNVARYQEASLAFSNYYNHTAATLKGLNGQLYSGFQLNDLDSNALISIQDIMGEAGYRTTFVNTEPHNEVWSDFLAHMNFQNTVGESVTGTYSLTGDIMSDFEAYQTLQSVVEEEAAEDEPFFICIYTFGTHATYDSPDITFGDGSDAELNKFYNCDYQFGQFMDWLERSGLSRNTVVVFTSDHATYRDLSFIAAFPDYDRSHYFLDAMPCFYYYSGIEAETIDVGGRNSLDFAPTLLDYLDVSGENYFMGASLFLEPDTVSSPQEGLLPMDMVYFDGTNIATSGGPSVEAIEGADLSPYMDEIVDYVSVSRVPL